jgi:SAM-dependent methyltransferase
LEFLRKLLRSPVAGVVDARGGRTIYGWAASRRDDKPVTVEVYVDGTNAGSVVADRFRPDLTTQAPEGRCAFEYTIPAEYPDGAEYAIEVRARGSRKPLTNGRFTVRLLSAEIRDALLRDILRDGLWALAGVMMGDTVHIVGWFIAPPGREGRITVNGEAVTLEIGSTTGDWKSPLPAPATMRTFVANLPLDPSARDMHFSFGGAQPFHPLRDYHYPLFNVVMPGAERRTRVHGNDSEFTFNLEGYSTAIKLDALAQRFAGQPLAGLGPVLDWGCGCGRVGRFVARNGADLYGVDIDADNVAWCAEHLDGRFATIAPEPPTAFADDFFGAIYGISVFTHLTQDYEALWLAELHRIAKPGGLLLLSTLGNVAAARENLLEHVMSHPSGFVDHGRNPGIDSVTQGSAYYRNVFHQSDYIKRVWGKYFEILAIEEGVVGNYQDLVVARKPA